MSGHDCMNKQAFSRLQKISSDGADIICDGKVFQSCGPATGNAWLPYRWLNEVAGARGSEISATK